MGLFECKQLCADAESFRGSEERTQLQGEGKTLRPRFRGRVQTITMRANGYLR